MPKFSVAITGVEIHVEDIGDNTPVQVLRDIAMMALKEAYALEEQTNAELRRRNFPAVGFYSEKDTSKPEKPTGIGTMNPEIKL